MGWLIEGELQWPEGDGRSFPTPPWFTFSLFTSRLSRPLGARFLELESLIAILDPDGHPNINRNDPSSRM